MHNDILLIDDDPGVARVMGQMLIGIGNARYAANARQAIAEVRRGVPDLILLDAEMPDMHGFDLCRVLKGEAMLENVPVIFVTANGEQQAEVSALESGASDFITKPVNAAVLRARVQTHLKIRRLADSLREQAMHDPLTGLENRRAFDTALLREWSRARRNSAPISLLAIDPDHLRAYNDYYGRPAGDECLRQITSRLTAAARRPCDLVARQISGGFFALLPDTGREGANDVAQRMMRDVAALAIPHAAPVADGRMAISVGIASFDHLSPNWGEGGAALRYVPLPEIGAPDLVANAENALHRAKQAGRGRCEFREVTHAARRRKIAGHEPAQSVPSGYSPPDTPPAVTPTANPAPSGHSPRVSTPAGRGASPIAEWPRIAGIDWEQSHLRLAGNRELFTTMVRRLVDEFATLDGETTDDRQAAILTARLHKLKGSAGTLAAIELEQLAARAERAFRSGDQPTASALVVRVREQLDRIRSDNPV